MLTVYAAKNNLKSVKKAYVFRSATCGTVSEEDFVKYIAESNTTVTEADTIAVMTLIKDLFRRYIEEGFAVKLPMGTFRAGASGTADSAEVRFHPARPHRKGAVSTDHTISLLFEPDRRYEKELVSRVDYRKMRRDIVCRPYIRCVYDPVKKEELSELGSGDILLIRGDYLKMDLDDQSQGVFLCSKKAGVPACRLERYVRNARRTVMAQIPAGLSDGTYYVRLSSRPRKTLYSDTSSSFVISNKPAVRTLSESAVNLH